MIDRASARAAVVALINSMPKDAALGDDEFVVVDEETIEKEYGWIFVYNSKRFMETGEFRHRLVGNGPVVVEKDSGVISQLGTGKPFDTLVREFEERRRQKPRNNQGQSTDRS